MGMGKAFKKAFGGKKKKSGGKPPKAPKTSAAVDMFGMNFGVGPNGGLMFGDEEVDARQQSPVLEQAESQGLGGASNTLFSMLNATEDLGYNLDSPVMPSWTKPEDAKGPGLGDSGIGLGMARLGKTTGNEIRRGPSVITEGPQSNEVNSAESAHVTHMLSYEDEIGLSGTHKGVFKSDPEIETADAARQYNIGQTEGDSRMAARAVASSRLDRALGTNVLSEDTFAEVNGEVGVLSPLVEGQALGYGTEGKLLDVDQDNDDFKRTLSDLEIMDFLTGQVDRHNANIFVGADGSAKGIDNDMAFGTNDLFEPDQKGRQNGNNIRRMPERIDAKTADSLSNMDADTFAAVIGGRAEDPQHLNEEEIEAALVRFTELQAHVGTLREDGGLIEDWSSVHGDRDAYSGTIEAGGGWASYLDRTDGYAELYENRADASVRHETDVKKKKKSTRKDLFA